MKKNFFFFVEAHTEWQWFLYILYMSKGKARCQNEKVAINSTKTQQLSLSFALRAHWMHVVLLRLWFLDSNSTVTFDIFRFNDRPNTNIKQKKKT